jgi:DNA replicative helicase MCM subunit Mcm2 (Cdc46/Mcm family)
LQTCILEDIKALATEVESDRYTIYERLPRLVAPHLEGALDQKLALCYSLASSPDYPVHLLLIGEPATVKTELIEEARRILPGAFYAGPRSTVSGLTANLDDGSLGLLARANGGLALFDELDKLPARATKCLYEAMESGRITINSRKLKRELESRFVCIATANPSGDILAKRAREARKQLLDSVSAALLSRFHLVFVLRTPVGKELEKTVSRILIRSGKENPDLPFLRRYFQTIKELCPLVRCELDPRSASVKAARKFLARKISASKRGRLSAPLSVRAAEALRRLCISSARMRLSPQVDDLDVRNALSVMRASLATWPRN